MPGKTFWDTEDNQDRDTQKEIRLSLETMAH